MSNKEILAQEIRDDEGLKLIAYPGPKTKKLHIGYGHLLEQEQHEEELRAIGLEDELDDWTGFEITKEQAEALLFIDIEDAIEGLYPSKKYIGWTEEQLDELDPERYIALLSMAFQLGGEGVRRKFPSFVKAVKSEDWERAADEMLWSNGLKKQRRSQWYKDTPDRCQLMADRMRKGVIKGDSTETSADAPSASVLNDIDLSTLSDAELVSVQSKIHAEIAKRLGVSYR